MFSKACEYGIRSLIYITMKSSHNERVNLVDISAAIDSPTAFTAKILQKLVKNNIVESVKGPHGGFHVAKESMDTISLSDVVKAIDGDTIYNGCGLGLAECNELRPCPLHDKFTQVRGDLKQMLKTTNLRSLAEELESGSSVLRV